MTATLADILTMTSEDTPNQNNLAKHSEFLTHRAVCEYCFMPLTVGVTCFAVLDNSWCGLAIGGETPGDLESGSQRRRPHGGQLSIEWMDWM